TAPAVAANGDGYLVVWADSRNYWTQQGNWNNESDVYGARVSTNGIVLDPSGIAISTEIRDQSSPSVASDGRDYLVVWEDWRRAVSVSAAINVYGARITAQGVVADPHGFPITLATGRQVAPSIAFNGHHYLVAWTAFPQLNTTPDIRGARVTTNGA